jgi:DNA-binding transcriptional LysR family regulator
VSCRPKPAGLLERLGPALDRGRSRHRRGERLRDRPAGALRLNVPVSAARLVLPAIVPRFLAAYPDIRLEIVIGGRVLSMCSPPVATPASAMMSGWSRT